MPPESSSTSVASYTSLRPTLSETSQSWTTFDLDSRRPHWDATVQKTKSHRETIQTARKSLSEHAKTFKKALKAAANPSDPVDIPDLTDKARTCVRAFQDEIDSLTKMCKASDTAFADLYKVLFHLPDPATVLQRALNAGDGLRDEVEGLVREKEELKREVQEYEAEFSGLKNQDITIRNLEAEVARLRLELEEVQQSGGKSGSPSSDAGDMALSAAEREELIKLRTEVAEYEVEFRGLKNQDITIRKLETRISEMDQLRDEEIATEVKKVQDELMETVGRRATEALEREARMEGKLRSVELQLRAERAGREATQANLLKADEGAEMREAAWDAQRQILVSDAERSRELLQDVSRERDELRLKVNVLENAKKDDSRVSPPGSAPGSGGMGVAEILAERRAYEAEVNELTMTVDGLREELRSKDESTEDERRKLQSTIQCLEDEISTLQSQVSTLQTQISSAPSSTAFEKMKRELRVLKRLEYNAELDDRHDNPEMTDQDLETVLVSRLQKTEGDLLKEKRERTERDKEILRLEGRISDLKREKERGEELVASLERDLQAAISANQYNLSTAAMSSSSPLTQTPSGSNTLQTILDPSAAAETVTTPSSPSSFSPATTSTSQTQPQQPPPDHSVTSIIMSQRDRLRTRCDTLEAERDSFKKELQIQVKLSESLKTDNTKLYEKVRYLQNFQDRQNSTSGGPKRDLDLEALEERYEASVDPFRQFNRAERARRLKLMSPPERIVFVTAKFVLGSKQMRTGLFVYVMSLHLLVFVTTYHWSHEIGCADLSSHESLAHLHGGVPIDESVAVVGAGV